MKKFLKVNRTPEFTPDGSGSGPITGETRVLVATNALSVVAAEFGGVSTKLDGVLMVVHGAGGGGGGVGNGGGVPVTDVVQPGGSAGATTPSKFSTPIEVVTSAPSTMV